MSVTIFADIETLTSVPKKKLRCVDKYTNLTNADFDSDSDYYKKDDEGFYYEMIPDVDGNIEANFANANFDSLLFSIDRNMAVSSRDSGNCGNIQTDDIPAFIHKVSIARNASGFDPTYFERSMAAIMEVCHAAVKYNVAINWG